MIKLLNETIFIKSSYMVQMFSLEALLHERPFSVSNILFLIIENMLFLIFLGVKKAKQFDFMAMFEQTRKTAMERSQRVFGM